MKRLSALRVWVLAAVLGIFFSITAIAADYTIYDCYWSEEADRAVAVWYRTETATSFKVGLFTERGKRVGSWHTTEDTSYDFTKAIQDNGSDSYYFIVYPVKGGESYAVVSDVINVALGDDADYEISYCEWSTMENRQVALWSRTEKETSFKVGIFTKKGTQVGSWHTTGSNYYDFSSAIKNKGSDTYYFVVYPVKGGKDYAICSDTIKVSVASEKRSSGSSSAKAPLTAGWVKNSNGTWSYRMSNGSLAADCWQSIDGKWYYFGSDNLMKTGWITTGGKWYYLEQNGTGSMPKGALYMNCTTPDGNLVDASGAWTGKKMETADTSWYTEEHGMGTISVTLPAGSSAGWNYTISNPEVMSCENAGSSSDGTHYMMFSTTGNVGSCTITFFSSLGMKYMDIWVNESGDFDITSAR